MTKTKSSSTQSLNFEQAMDRMAQIATNIESPEISVDQILALIQEAELLFETCQTKLHKAEEKISHSDK